MLGRFVFYAIVSLVHFHPFYDCYLKWLNQKPMKTKDLTEAERQHILPDHPRNDIARKGLGT